MSETFVSSDELLRSDILQSPSSIKGESASETREMKEMVKACRNYIEQYPWCKSIEETFVGILLPGIVCVCLFRIEPSRPGGRRWFWGITGDLPSAYIDAEDSRTPACALDTYVGVMMEWVVAVRKGKSTRDCIPVNVPPTKEWAENLANRMEFLYRDILKKYYKDEIDLDLDERVSGSDYFA